MIFNYFINWSKNTSHFYFGIIQNIQNSSIMLNLPCHTKTANVYRISIIVNCALYSNIARCGFILAIKDEV